MSLTDLIHFLSLHRSIMYLVLFAGSYLETFIVTSFFIYGEFFFVAGGMLAGVGAANIWVVVAILSLGGILGDHSSYALGRFAGDGIYERFERTPVMRRAFTRQNHARGLRFFNKYGGWSVAIGRFLGPVSWITPFLSGVFKLPYGTFAVFEAPAAVLGIGQFILLGYLFGASYTKVIAIVEHYFLSVVFVLVVLALVAYLLRRTIRRMERNLREATLHFFLEVKRGNTKLMWRAVRISCYLLLVVLILYTIALILIFFVENQRIMGALPPDLSGSYTSIPAIIKSIDETTYYKRGTSDIEPINLVIITNRPIDQVMASSSWIYTTTFARGHIALTTFLRNAEDGQLPISDLSFKGVPQNSAFEYANSTLTTREHLRIWNYGQYQGKHVYAVSASKDAGLDIYRSLTFIVPYHRIDPEVDVARHFVVATLVRTFPSAIVHTYESPLGVRTRARHDDSLYVTDGKITVVEL